MQLRQNRGCLESICGIPALLRKAKSEMPLIGSDDPLTICFREKGIITIEDIMQRLLFLPVKPCKDSKNRY